MATTKLKNKKRKMSTTKKPMTPFRLPDEDFWATPVPMTAFDTTTVDVHPTPTAEVILPIPPPTTRWGFLAPTRKEYTQEELREKSIHKLKPGQWVKVSRDYIALDQETDISYIAVRYGFKYRFNRYSDNMGFYAIVSDEKGYDFWINEENLILTETNSRLPNFL